MTQSNGASTTTSEAGAPIVCNPHVLGRDVLAKQVELNMNVRVRWPKSKQQLEDGFLYEYEGNEELFLTLAKYATDEHRCCPWLAFSVQMSPFREGRGRVQLKMSAEGPDAKQFLIEETKYWDEWLTQQDPEKIDYQKVADGFMALLGPMVEMERARELRDKGALTEGSKGQRR